MSELLGVVGPIYETSMSPERIDELIQAWERRVDEAELSGGAGLALLGSGTVLPHVERAREILSRLHGGDQMYLGDALSAIRLAAFVLTPQGVVVSTNEAAQACFDLYPGDSIRRRMGSNSDFGEIAGWIDRLILEGRQGDSILPLRSEPEGRLRFVSLHPTRTPSGQMQILVCTSDLIWPEELNRRLADQLGLTAAEISVLRQMALGETVSSIARSGGRKESTVRSQLHALMEKTGTKSQPELVRLANMLLASLPPQPQRQAPARALESMAERKSSLRLSDGRRIEFFHYGAANGHPVIWLQSTLCLFRPTPAQDACMRELGLKVIVVVRAGFGRADPVPAKCNPLEVAVRDTMELIRTLDLPRCAIVAPSDDIRIALMLTQAVPAQISQIIALGPCFPIRNDAQYRRMHRTGRFFRACARHAPAVLPFLAGAFRAMVLRTGIEGYAMKVLAGSPGDSALFQDRDVAEAFIGGFTYLFGAGAKPEQAFCAELQALHADWPDDLGHVACPVQIFHGLEDGNAPVETVRDYVAMHPSWRLEVVQGVGQLLIHKHWPEILAHLARPAATPLGQQTMGQAAS